MDKVTSVIDLFDIAMTLTFDLHYISGCKQ